MERPLKVKDAFSFSPTPLGRFAFELRKWYRAQAVGSEMSSYFQTALLYVATLNFDDIDNDTELVVGVEVSLASMRLDEHPTPPFTSSRVARIVRDIRALYWTGLRQVGVSHLPVDHALREAALPSISEDTNTTRSSRVFDADVGCYKPDLCVMFETTREEENYIVASAVWDVKCSQPSSTDTQNLKNIDWWKRGMVQISLYIVSNNELGGGDLGGYIYDMKFLRMKVISARGKTLIVFDVAEGYTTAGDTTVPRFLHPQQKLDASLMDFMPHSLKPDQPGRQMLWDSFSVAARRFEDYEMHRPPPRLNVQDRPGGTADCLLEAWDASPDADHDYYNSWIQQAAWTHAHVANKGKSGGRPASSVGQKRQKRRTSSSNETLHKVERKVKRSKPSRKCGASAGKISSMRNTDKSSPAQCPMSLHTSAFTHAKTDKPMSLPDSEKNASMELTLDRLDQYPSVDRGDSPDRVKSFVTGHIAKRDQRLANHGSLESDASSEADLSTEDMLKVLVALGVGFVAVSPATMDKLIEESRVIMPEASSCIKAEGIS